MTIRVPGPRPRPKAMCLGLAIINPPVELEAVYCPWASMASDIERLAAGGVEPLGHVSIGYGTRPLVDLRDMLRLAV